MTDRRVTDLSYGHLGEASYDTEVNRWEFSNTKDRGKKNLEYGKITAHRL